MRNKSFISVLIVITILMGASCSKKETTSQDSTDNFTFYPTTNSSVIMPEDIDSSSDHEVTDPSSGFSEESIPSSESEHSTESISKEGLSAEDALVSACEELGFPLERSAYNEDIDTYTFEKGSFRIHALIEKDEAGAKRAYRETIDYGGWYEEPVLKEIRSEDGDYLLWAVYSDLGDGKRGMFVNYARENIWASIETFNDEYVESIEAILRGIGCDID